MENLGERVAVLETKITHLSEQLDDTHRKVDEMHAVLLQAKGAKWVIVGAAGLIGFLASLVAKIPFVSGMLPK